MIRAGGAAIAARGVGRAWGGRVVVADVDLEVAPGEVVALVGPNGGGKSTLLSMFAGLVRPTWGTVTIGGVPAADIALAATGSVGLVTPEPGLYPLLTGWENLRFFGALYGLGADRVDAGAQPLLAALRVDAATLDTPVAGWSSGTRQKVSLVRALLLGPPVLLLDEPTSNLDPLTSRILHAAIRSRADAGAAVVVATHDLHAAEHVCDRVVGIDRRVVGIHRLTGARTAPPPSPLLALFAADDGPTPLPPGPLAAATAETPLPPGPLAGEGRGGGRAARILAVARREWLEQRRQPGMLGAVGTLYGVVAAVAVFGVLALDYVERRPAGEELVGRLLSSTPEALAASTVGAFDFLAFTQLLGIAAVAGGHALLHDRHCGTLVFLLLAPVRRVELLVGKVVGAIGWAVLLYAVLSGGAAVVMAAIPVTRHSPELTATSPAFWVAFAVGAPAWAALLGAVGTMLSAVARDVRGAQQGVWFVVFFASLIAGGLLTWGLGAGVAAELAVAGLGASAAAAVVAGGAQILSRDMRRS